MALAASRAYLEALRRAPPDECFDARVMEPVEIKAAQSGRVLCGIRVPANLTNSYGTLHGGAIATLIDCVSTMAVLTTGGTNLGVSIDLGVTYVSAARIDDELEIESKVLKMGKNLVMLSVEVRRAGENGEIVASGHHTKYFSRSLASKL